MLTEEEVLLQLATIMMLTEEEVLLQLGTTLTTLRWGALVTRSLGVEIENVLLLCWARLGCSQNKYGKQML